jgi:hypothetical protein
MFLLVARVGMRKSAANGNFLGRKLAVINNKNSDNSRLLEINIDKFTSWGE